MRLEESQKLEVLAYERGLSTRTLDLADIQMDTRSGPTYGWWRIPYPHQNGVWKYRYKNPTQGAAPKYRDDPGAEFHLYNPLTLRANEDEVWFCEGEFDTLVLVELGLKAIGIHGVKNVGEEDHEGRFRREWKLLFEDTKCVIAFDNDEQGRTAGRRLANGLDGHVFDEWDDEYGDLNAWYIGDRSGLVAAIDRFCDRLDLRVRVEEGQVT